MADAPRHARRRGTLFVLDERGDRGDVVGLEGVSGPEDPADQDSRPDSTDEERRLDHDGLSDPAEKYLLCPFDAAHVP